MKKLIHGVPPASAPFAARSTPGRDSGSSISIGSKNVITNVDPNSEAAEKGFRPGDVIVSVGNKNVRAPADIEQGITEAKRANRESVLFLVVGRGGQRYVALKTPQT